ncbi:unnamed protein product [Rotaria magnacalcarata]|uniref:Membralin n=1 Tax=Rotaria magnacalcarata TaxID=392030 RepID=A0A819Y2Z0_9BILA|nr:unnamed protein product [Rotaria magnacalcarata]CAF2124494.1 unnamed protein product [Rotaria magnacalcarata]CAF2129705.1 unnamed protein product [Rotaria magnacalcarata]CAF3904011.1 unnamed protein product [Rotaria magnacalcarata]CAF3989712.1 unnamed protein product [Rotaria magnacalcarata]
MSNNASEVISTVRVNQQPPPPPPRIPPPTADGDTMERLFQALFYRIAVLYARNVPKHIRRLGETAILVMAIVCMALLIYLHVVFNQKPVTCLSHLHDRWPRQGILRVELFFESPPKDYNLQQSYAKEFQYSHFYNYDENYRNYSILKPNETIVVKAEFPIEKQESERLEKSYPNMSINFSLLSPMDYISKSIMKKELINSAEIINDNSLSEIEDDLDNESLFDYLFNFDWLKQLLIEEHYILEYSIEYGFLRLSPETRQRLNIEVLLVTLDMTNNTCFGNDLSRFMLDQFLGYQEILMSSIKQLAEKETHKGYVRNVMTNDHFRFVSTWQNRRWWTYLVALCIMIVFTVSISMLLRYSHFQIFLFIIDLLRMIEHNTSIVFPAAPLLTVILALIGMEAIMSEFFSDASTAFYIILIVWISDQYDSICCHTPISKRHWVRFFYLYHFAFYAYHARYNGQYSGLALTTSCCFIAHSMFYFFHHFELPVIEAQLVHVFVDDQIITQTPLLTTERTREENSPTTTP